MRRRLDRGLRQVAFFVVPTVLAFVSIGRLLVAALFQTGRFGADQTAYVWYILVGSTVGMLAMTLGRLYSSALYALRDTRTPLRFAIARVALTAVLGLLFAFPLRFVLIAGARAVGLPLPAGVGGEAAMGTVGLTSSAGVAAWLEFVLLRRAVQRRVGAAALPARYQVQLWSAAVVSAAVAVAVDAGAIRPIAGLLPVGHVAEAAAAIAVFAAAYLGATLALGVPEAAATLRRLRR